MIDNKEIMAHLLTIEVILKTVYNIKPYELDAVLEDMREYIEKCLKDEEDGTKRENISSKMDK